MIYVNVGKVDNKIGRDQEFDVPPDTIIFFCKPHRQHNNPMIECCVIETDDNENKIERETQTQTTNMNTDTKKVAFATVVPVTVGDVDVDIDVDGTNEEVLVVNDTIVGSLESQTASRSAQRDPPESSNKTNKIPPCPPGKSPIPSPHNNVNG